MTEKESKDKKIREAILNGLIDCRDAPDLEWSNFGGIHIDDCIDWLEKQGEQASSQTNERAWLYLVSDVLTWKEGIGQYLDDPRVQELAKRLCSEYAQKLYNPSVLSNTSSTGKNEQQSDDKIESKFHKGDWITIDKPCQIINIHDNGNYIVQYCDDEKAHELSKNFCESYFHFWTIKDAKDGDVLVHSSFMFDNFIFIYNNTSILQAYCCYSNERNKFIIEDRGHHCPWNMQEVTPATKEQRDALMKVMNDAGYEWNAETKTLEKLVEPKFKVGDKIVNLPMKYMGGSWTQGTISKITDDKYIFTDSSYIFISSQDSWELVDNKKPKFDPKTLKPFDRVLVRDDESLTWNINMFSYIDYPYRCLSSFYRYCIPYNNDTKHLIGTTDEAPEYYRYWED